MINCSTISFLVSAWKCPAEEIYCWIINTKDTELKDWDWIQLAVQKMAPDSLILQELQFKPQISMLCWLQVKLVYGLAECTVTWTELIWNQANHGRCAPVHESSWPDRCWDWFDINEDHIQDKSKSRSKDGHTFPFPTASRKDLSYIGISTWHQTYHRITAWRRWERTSRVVQDIKSGFEHLQGWRLQ